MTCAVVLSTPLHMSRSIYDLTLQFEKLPSFLYIDCQHSLHRETLLLVGSHAAPLPSGTVFLHLYALLTVLLVLGLSSRLICS